MQFPYLLFALSLSCQVQLSVARSNDGKSGKVESLVAKVVVIGLIGAACILFAYVVYRYWAPFWARHRLD